MLFSKSSAIDHRNFSNLLFVSLKDDGHPAKNRIIFFLTKKRLEQSLSSNVESLSRKIGITFQQRRRLVAQEREIKGSFIIQVGALLKIVSSGDRQALCLAKRLRNS